MQQGDLENVFERRFTKAQDNYKACCPFHDERNPSFYVHQSNLIAHCFGCGVGGNIEALASRYTGEPLEKSLQRLGISAKDKLNRVAQRSREADQAKTTYPESWLAPWKKEAHKYVLKRGFTRGTLRAVGSLFDPNLKRQVFPHRNRDGELLGCAGRTCREEDPKWLFYWAYNKGQALYAPLLDERWDPSRPTVVVEGIFDYLWLIQKEVDYNVAATLGAFATRHQLAQLKGLGTTIIAGYDNDAAGSAGSAHLFESLRRSTPVRFTDLPEDCKDWAEMDDPEDIRRVLRDASNPVQLALRNQGSRLICDCSRHTYLRERARRLSEASERYASL